MRWQLGGGLPGVQLSLGLPPPRVPGAVRAAQAVPGFGRSAPRRRVAVPGQPGPLGIPGRPLSRDSGHKRVVGERRAGHLVHPEDQAVSGGHGG